MDWLTAEQALEQLGVRRQTLYAYVSRGRVAARPDPADSRRSLYRADDIAGLSRRKARGRKPALIAEDAIAWGEPVLASAITTVIDGRLYYRGRDAVEMAESGTLETTGRWLRGGEPVSRAVRRVAAAPPNSDAKARAFAFLAARAGADPPAQGRAAAALAAEADGLLNGLADAVAGQVDDGPIHIRLARAWGCDDAGGELIRRALVLLADHELNASTFAARVAASTGAAQAAAALAGLSALSGPLHGAMSARVRAFAVEAERIGAQAAVRERIGQGLPLPGFGHPLYPAGDPRAQALLAAFRPPALFQDLQANGEAQTGKRADIDFALTALAFALGLPEDAGFLIFAVARCAGWLAHAAEQLQSGGLIRPRARYIGSRPIQKMLGS